MPMNRGDIARKLAGIVALLEAPLSDDEQEAGWSAALKRKIEGPVSEALMAVKMGEAATLSSALTAIRAAGAKGILTALIADADQRLGSVSMAQV